MWLRHRLQYLSQVGQCEGELMVLPACKSWPSRANVVFLSGIWTVCSGRIGLLIKGPSQKNLGEEGGWLESLQWLSTRGGTNRVSDCSGAIRGSAGVWLELLLCFKSSSSFTKLSEISKNLFPLVSRLFPPSLTWEMFFKSEGPTKSAPLCQRAPPKPFTFGNSFWLLFNSYYSSSSARNLTHFYL